MPCAASQLISIISQLTVIAFSSPRNGTPESHWSRWETHFLTTPYPVDPLVERDTDAEFFNRFV